MPDFLYQQRLSVNPFPWARPIWPPTSWQFTGNEIVLTLNRRYLLNMEACQEYDGESGNKLSPWRELKLRDSSRVTDGQQRRRVLDVPPETALYLRSLQNLSLGCILSPTAGPAKASASRKLRILKIGRQVGSSFTWTDYSLEVNKRPTDDCPAPGEDSFPHRRRARSSAGGTHPRDRGPIDRDPK